MFHHPLPDIVDLCLEIMINVARFTKDEKLEHDGLTNCEKFIFNRSIFITGKAFYSFVSGFETAIFIQKYRSIEDGKKSIE